MEQADVSILVVDDVNTVRIQLKELLRSFGFKKIRVAANASEAQSALEEEPIHLVCCDWHMTPVNGLDFLKYVRSHPTFKSTAFLMITAESTRELVLEAIKAGVDDYIVKPLTLAHVNKIYGVLLKRQIL